MKLFSIRENHLFKKSYKQGKRCGAKSIVVYVLRDRAAGLLKKQNPQKELINRVGISASKKVGGAVQRNRAKRVIREAYRKTDKQIGIKRGHLIVIVPKEYCTVCSMREVYGDLKYCLGSLGMLKEQPDEDVSNRAGNITEADTLEKGTIDS